VRLLHSLAKTHASFDDPDLVSHAGLVPVMALGERAGLAGLLAEHFRPGGSDASYRGRADLRHFGQPLRTRRPADQGDGSDQPASPYGNSG
jgi:hypothetical protein